MRLLVLGGSSFVGRALVEEGLARGWDMTTFNRGGTKWADDRVARLLGDRLVADDVAQLALDQWDVVADTWSGAPRAARESASLLADRAGRYVYVSSGSVYSPPPRIDGDESAPTVDGSPDAEEGSYPELKRGAELAVAAAFGDRALLARAGTILGPHEDVGRLPWWLLRLHRGGEVLAPGPPGLPLQYIDARDLAAWLLDAAVAGRAGPFNVVSRPGHATMGTLLEACRSVTGGTACLTWAEPDFIQANGIEPWQDLPIWIPADHDYRGMHAANVDRAHAAGLRCRPLEQTVSDTWEWLRSVDLRPPLRRDLDPPGLDADTERTALAAWRER